MNGVHAHAVVIDERDLTKALNKNDVELTVAEFGSALTEDDGVHATALIKTTETSEERARSLLDYHESAIVRLLGGGDDVRVDLRILTHQEVNSANVKLTDASVRLATASLGMYELDSREAEHFVATRLVAEHELLHLRFRDTDYLTGTELQTTLPSGRVVRAQRARDFV
jgi:hypothetical protein